ncbi:MAG TPA: hypothetical protein VJ650_12120 [Gemmatimonadaceae bacterium]|nr:hypothetical protein [Gemmatimonadaceae bacterium]
MTDTTQTDAVRKAAAISSEGSASASSSAQEAERPIDTSREWGFSGYDPRSIQYVDARVDRLEQWMKNVDAHLQHLTGHSAFAHQSSTSNSTNSDPSRPPPPPPTANKTADYVVASAYAAALMWANPDMRRGGTQFLPLAPALLSLMDDGLTREGGKRALIPALVGIGSVIALGGLLK